MEHHLFKPLSFFSLNLFSKNYMQISTELFFSFVFLKRVNQIVSLGLK